VTGNICSGKTSLVKYIGRKPNGLIMNLDETVHQIYNRNLFVEKSIKENFCKGGEKSEVSQKVYKYPNTIFQEFNRKELGKLVFNDDLKINRLNKIIKSELRIKMLSDFSKIEYDLLREVKENETAKKEKKYFLFVEGAMMMEAGFHVNYLILIKYSIFLFAKRILF